MTDFSQLGPYDDAWVVLFKNETKFLMKLLPEDYLLEFHHIGSTAIPEMPAKPIIDIGVMITSFVDADLKIRPIMRDHGYAYKWCDERGPGFITFSKMDDEHAYHVHMAVEDHDFWDCLYFREYLKRNPIEAKTYFDLKNELAKQFAENHIAYNAGKEEYIKRITEIAKRELEEF